MDAALELFRSGGYQKTMIIDITKKAGAAKGTFYHYYPSKEAILEAICNRWAIKMATSFERENRQLSALPKLQLFTEHLFHPHQLNVLFKRLWDEEQLNLYYKTWRGLVETVFNPLLAEIIEQGNREETMHVACRNQAIAFFWSTLHCVWEAIFFQEPAEVIASKTKMAQSLLERILGIEKNTFEISLTNYWLA
ncbi:MAG TPA: TetR/AcrR family transcriptional regulator [Selenomonadales bacterium]|nr:TetR/AcrR family transcriptional regulator [Selenomonadales bacterium]